MFRRWREAGVRRAFFEGCLSAFDVTFGLLDVPPARRQALGPADDAAALRSDVGNALGDLAGGMKRARRESQAPQEAAA